MTAGNEANRLERSVRVYRRLLAIFPAQFRGRFGVEMVQTFRDTLRDATQIGPRAVAAFWLRTLLDAVVSGSAQRLGRSWIGARRIVVKTVRASEFWLLVGSFGVNFYFWNIPEATLLGYLCIWGLGAGAIIGLTDAIGAALDASDSGAFLRFAPRRILRAVASCAGWMAMLRLPFEHVFSAGLRSQCALVPLMILLTLQAVVLLSPTFKRWLHTAERLRCVDSGIDGSLALGLTVCLLLLLWIAWPGLTLDLRALIAGTATLNALRFLWPRLFAVPYRTTPGFAGETPAKLESPS